MKKSIAVTLFALVSLVNLSAGMAVIHRHHGRTAVAVTDPTSAMPMPVDLGAYLGAK
jgi:hypothetical protein